MGRDKLGRSMIMGMDGDCFIQVGGFGISTDSRFGSEDNGFRGGVLDIRILRPGFEATMIRVDQTGLGILVNGQTKIHSQRNYDIKIRL